MTDIGHYLLRFVFCAHVLVLVNDEHLKCMALEPITTGILLGTAGYGLYAFTKCKVVECCSEPWVGMRIEKLRQELDQNIYGQHIAKNIVLSSLEGHFKNPNPKKALVLSFHGWTGGGKNYVVSHIAKNLYYEGVNSKYFHQFFGGKDFGHHDWVEHYKIELAKKISTAVQECPYSLFVFDEVDKMAPGVLDAISTFTEHYEHVDGIDYRKAIFIFLNNVGGVEISEVAFRFWSEGKKREDITLEDIEPLITKGAFNANGGLKNSYIIEKNLIDSYVPFLPLEKDHVRKCISDDLKSKKRMCSADFLSAVLKNLRYYPEELELYSVKGCKTVPNKVDNLLYMKPTSSMC